MFLIIIFSFNAKAEAAEEVNGLLGEYYNSTDFTKLVRTKIDPELNFGWASDRPDYRVYKDNFSIRWTGYVVPRHTSEDYIFRLTADDGVRLYVNDTLIIDHWQGGGYNIDSSTIQLNADHKYSIKIEFWEGGGNYRLLLYWRSSHQAYEIIPTTRLYPPLDYTESYNDIFVSDDGIVWATNSANDVFVFKNNIRKKIDNQKLEQIYVTPGGDIYGVDLSGYINYKKKGGIWQQTSVTAAQIWASGNGLHIWRLARDACLNTDHNLYVRKGDYGQWTGGYGNLVKQISITEDYLKWAVDASGNVFFRRRSDTSWTEVSGITLNQISVANDGRVWGTKSSGEVYTCDAIDGTWEKVDSEVKIWKVFAITNNRVYGLNFQGEIMYRNGVNGKWISYDKIMKTYNTMNLPKQKLHITIGGQVSMTE